MIYGLPIVLSTYKRSARALVGDFAIFAELSLRRGIEFQ